MNNLEAPFLEFGFYFANTSDANAFALLVTELLILGAKFKGDAWVYRDKDARNKPFTSTYEDGLPEEVIMDLPSLISALSDSDTRVVQIAMHEAIGISQGAAEIVTYLRISPEAARVDQHPLVIMTEGELFSSPESFRSGLAEDIEKASKKVYQRFRSLIERLNPAYATITVEYGLKCPFDLHRDPHSLAFRNFFVSGTYLGHSNISDIEKMFDGAYKEYMADGLYVSTYEDLNPEKKSLDAVYSQYLSAAVGKLIASKFRSHKS